MNTKKLLSEMMPPELCYTVQLWKILRCVDETIQHEILLYGFVDLDDVAALVKSVEPLLDPRVHVVILRTIATLHPMQIRSFKPTVQRS